MSVRITPALPQLINLPPVKSHLHMTLVRLWTTRVFPPINSSSWLGCYRAVAACTFPTASQPLRFFLGLARSSFTDGDDGCDFLVLLESSRFASAGFRYLRLTFEEELRQ